MTTVLSQTLPDLLSTPLGGRGMSATLIQPRSHRPLIPILRQNMYAHIYNVNPAAPAHQVEQVVRESLSRLAVYRVKARNRWKDVALSLRHLIDQSCPRPRPGSRSRSSEDQHQDHVDASDHEPQAHPRGKGGGRRGGLDFLLIDGIGDSHYPQRWADEQRQAQRSSTNPRSSYSTGTGGSGVGAGRVVMPDELGMREVMEAIGRVRLELGAVVVLSNQGLRTSRESQPFFIPHLPAPFPTQFAPPPPPSTYSTYSHSSTSASAFVSASAGTQNVNALGMRQDSTYWPLNIQITLTGKMRGLQYPGETTLVDALNGKRRFASSPGAGRVGMGMGSYEGIVRLDGGGLSGTGTGTGVEKGSNGDTGSRRGEGRFRFGISDEGLRVFSEEDA
ncbi:hypothetical protein I317_07504 [Kwoniella heveanensis CBS 569]|nr:hypothetical protein I317_07504 [Kwoniella heveanensis CBS 569]